MQPLISQSKPKLLFQEKILINFVEIISGENVIFTTMRGPNLIKLFTAIIYSCFGEKDFKIIGSLFHQTVLQIVNNLQIKNKVSF